MLCLGRVVDDHHRFIYISYNHLNSDILANHPIETSCMGEYEELTRLVVARILVKVVMGINLGNVFIAL